MVWFVTEYPSCSWCGLSSPSPSPFVRTVAREGPLLALAGASRLFAAAIGRGKSPLRQHLKQMGNKASAQAALTKAQGAVEAATGGITKCMSRDVTQVGRARGVSIATEGEVWRDSHTLVADGHDSSGSSAAAKSRC